MLLGQVAGKVWATKKSPALTGQAFLTVRVGERLLVCADCVGAVSYTHLTLPTIA